MYLTYHEIPSMSNTLSSFIGQNHAPLGRSSNVTTLTRPHPYGRAKGVIAREKRRGRRIDSSVIIQAAKLPSSLHIVYSRRPPPELDKKKVLEPMPKASVRYRHGALFDNCLFKERRSSQDAKSASVASTSTAAYFVPPEVIHKRLPLQLSSAFCHIKEPSRGSGAYSSFSCHCSTLKSEAPARP